MPDPSRVPVGSLFYYKPIDEYFLLCPGCTEHTRRNVARGSYPTASTEFWDVYPEHFGSYAQKCSFWPCERWIVPGEVQLFEMNTRSLPRPWEIHESYRYLENAPPPSPPRTVQFYQYQYQPPNPQNAYVQYQNSQVPQNPNPFQSQSGWNTYNFSGSQRRGSNNTEE